MLRATPSECNGFPTLKLEGKLSGPWVDELRKCWLQYLEGPEHGKVRVNLRELSFLDPRGRDLLLEMERDGARLEEASDFIGHLLADCSDHSLSARRIRTK